MSRRTPGILHLALLTAAITVGCAQAPEVQDIGPDEWSELESTSVPRVIYVWASWSRPAVELLPTVVELESEYEPLGVEFRYVSLDVDSAAAALDIMREIEGPPFYRLALPLEQASALVGIQAPPAVLGFAPDGRRLVLEAGSEEEVVAGEDIAGLVEQLVANDFEVDEVEAVR